MRRGIIFIMLAAVVALGIGAGVAYAVASRSAGAALAGSTWTLTRLEVDGQVRKPLAAKRAPTISFQHNGQFNGFSGCNSYGGDYALDGDRVTLSDQHMTLVACVEPGLTTDSDTMTFEATYIQALSRVTIYRVSGDTLTLSDGRGAVSMTFSRG